MSNKKISLVLGFSLLFLLICSLFIPKDNNLKPYKSTEKFSESGIFNTFSK